MLSSPVLINFHISWIRFNVHSLNTKSADYLPVIQQVPTKPLLEPTSDPFF